ncbi:MAG TPA: hypothetical protein VK466_03850 [Terriglobales bacterium]|nr:hypothetical protein [Terriglobales bacterium]
MRADTRGGIAGTVVRDRIECEVGFGVFGKIAEAIFLPPQIGSIFRHRQRTLAQLLPS